MDGPTICAVGTKAETSHHVSMFSNSVGGIMQWEPNEALHKLQPGDLAIFYSEHFDRFRNCCIELKKRQVATLYMIDGILEWRNAWENRPEEPACPWTMRTVLSHKVACIGPSQMRQLNRWGNADKTELVGIPRLDEIGSQWRLPTANTATSAPARKRIMVATAKTPGFTEEQISRTKESLLDIKNLLTESKTNFQEVEVLWRIDPKIAGELGIKNQLSDFSGPELIQQISEVDAVITTPSTLMLEAALARRPVCLLNYHNAPTLVPAAWEVRHRDHMPVVLEEILTGNSVKMRYQDEFLADELQCSERASPRMARLIEEMLSIAAKCIEKKVPLNFPASLLSSPPEQSQNLNLPTLFPLWISEGFDSGEQMKAEIAQARREIEHLQRELSQAKSELGDAHRIFEQIQRHPIAGPIVRIRQSFRDWLNLQPKEQTTN